MTVQGRVAIPCPEASFAAADATFIVSGTNLAPKSPIPRPEWIEVAWPGWTDKIASAMIGKPIAGILSDGRYAIVEPAAVIAVSSNGDARTARFTVKTLRFYDYRPAGHGVAAWVYVLLNFRLGGVNRCGDLQVHECRPDGGGKWYRDTVKFQYAGREWFVRDLLDHNDDKELRDFGKHWTPIASGRLWTERRAGDVADDLDQQAMQIENLLSLVVGRAVRWSERADIDATGAVTGGKTISIWCAGAKDGGHGPIDTGMPGSLKAFLEAAGPVVAADTDWWNRTLEFHLQGMLSPIVDVRLTFFYMLLDRISTKVVGTKFPAQIDEQLKPRLADAPWRKVMEAVLGMLSPNWQAHHTEAIIANIKQWNAGPSFTKRVQMAAKALGLPEPLGKVVSPRNPLLHEGEVPDEFPAGIEHLGNFSCAVESLITSMILRMLQHAGPAYLPDAGRDYLPINPWPKDRPCPWVPA